MTTSHLFFFLDGVPKNAFQKNMCLQANFPLIVAALCRFLGHNPVLTEDSFSHTTPMGRNNSAKGGKYV